jgi:hypothetical protein
MHWFDWGLKMQVDYETNMIGMSTVTLSACGECVVSMFPLSMPDKNNYVTVMIKPESATKMLRALADKIEKSNVTDERRCT